MKGFKPELLLPSLVSVLVAAAACERDDLAESEPLTKDEAYRLGKADWTTDFCDENGWYDDGVCDDFCPLPDPECAPDGGCLGFPTQPGIDRQCPDASPALAELLVCMRRELPGGVGQISSISDGRGGLSCRESYSAASCVHVRGSCHYGGTCDDGSHAVDFGDEWNAGTIRRAAYACGAGYAEIHNGNHVHVSVGRGCGCT